MWFSHIFHLTEFASSWHIEIENSLRGPGKKHPGNGCKQPTWKLRERFGNLPREFLPTLSTKSNE